MNKINDFINAYNLLLSNTNGRKKSNKSVVFLRESFLVSLVKKLIEIAWDELGYEKERLSLQKQTVRIPLNTEYLKRIKEDEVREFIQKNIKDFYYTLKTDVHVYIDDEFVIGVECKAFTENAMLKRILVDFTLFKNVFPDLYCVLFQLESQLGGDYSEISKKITFGSHSTHTLMSYFDIDLYIFTMLEGERKVDKPIHKEQHFKELEPKSVLKAIEMFKDLLKENVERKTELKFFR